MGKENEGDPSRLIIYREGPSIGPEGFRLGDPNNFIALGNEEDVLGMLRAMGFSEEALQAFRSGTPLLATIQETPFGRFMVEEDFEGKKKGIEGLGDNPLEITKHGTNSGKPETSGEDGPDDGDMLG